MRLKKMDKYTNPETYKTFITYSNYYKSESQAEQMNDLCPSLKKNYDILVSDLCEINDFPRDYSLKVGQKIKIPGKQNVAKADSGDRPLDNKSDKSSEKKTSDSQTAKNTAKEPKEQQLKDNSPKKTQTEQRKFDTYTVQKGDTFWRIAKTNDITVDELKSLNNLTSEATLKVGQKLKIPTK